MFLKEKETGHLIKVMDDVDDLISPALEEVKGRIQTGEEEQDPEKFHKSRLVFPSGEALPRCWVDPEYQND